MEKKNKKTNKQGKKKTTTNNTKEVMKNKEFIKVQDEINKELIKEEKEAIKKKKNNGYYLFIKAFITKLKEDKIYLFSFIITIVFFGIISVNKLRTTEGYYDKRQDTETNTNSVTPTVDTSLNSSAKDEEELDISNYVGIYSREITMSSPVVLSDTCSITSYKLVYQIKKDKSIAEYLVNDCLGTIKIWDDKLEYVSSGGARYISANSINYLFSASSMKEVDGETYKIDDDINSIKVNKKIKDLTIDFVDDNMIFVTNDDLILVKGNTISYRLKDKYTNNGGSLDKMVYKSATNNVYKFIVFNNSDEKSCYTQEEILDEEFNDSENYVIYSIKYNKEDNNFAEEKVLTTRNKSAGCDVYDEDLELLKE